MVDLDMNKILPIIQNENSSLEELFDCLKSIFYSNSLWDMYTYRNIYYYENLPRSLYESILFERLEALYPIADDYPDVFRGREESNEPLDPCKTVISNWLAVLHGSRPFKRIVPYLPDMSFEFKYYLVLEKLIHNHKPCYSKAETQFLLSCLNFENDYFILESLTHCKFEEKDILMIEDNLLVDKKHQDPVVLDIYLQLDDDELANLLKRFINAKTRKKRLTALELMQKCKQKNRLSELCDELQTQYKKRTNLLDIEKHLLGITSPMVLLDQKDVNGIENLFLLLDGLGKHKLVHSSADNFPARFSQKIYNCKPLGTDTKEVFQKHALEMQLSEERLLELGFFAEQWREYIDYVLDWKGYLNAMEWFDNPFEKRNQFNEVYQLLGEERWQQLLKIDSQNPESQLSVLTDIFLGNLTFDTFLERLKEISRIDYTTRRKLFYYLGTVPLPKGNNRQEELLYRYQCFQDIFRAAGNNENDKNCIQESILMLVEEAGFSDLETFQFFMEKEIVKDLKDGAVEVTLDEYLLRLSLNPVGEPVFEVFKDGVIKRSLPKALKDDPQVNHLKERVKQIKKMTTRLRRFLENSMCSERKFSPQALNSFCENPVLKILLEQVVFHNARLMGYPVNECKALLLLDGQEVALQEEDVLQITHPCEMLKRGDWHRWQAECFAQERVQPFKQIFREVYTVTEAEMNEEAESLRFSNLPIEAGNAVGLFRARGWKIEADFDKVSYASKYFDGHGFEAKSDTVLYLYLATTEETTFENIYFVDYKNKKIPLQEIPAIIFSETMRDIDLVVSKAYVGETSWEQSTTTKESRALLINETCRLLNIKNVKTEDGFAWISGRLGNYKVHLGSGSVHQLPGNYVCIIPDPKVKNSNLYLPFVDKDMVSAIILSKVLLLARDETITDPIILSQLRPPDWTVPT
ncbi:MAG: hypothetical protein CL609_15020 [Anaerolineaceae bacterium]|nr:hypothetical protein [Anaerolineaceae bacterium]